MKISPTKHLLKIKNLVICLLFIGFAKFGFAKNICDDLFEASCKNAKNPKEDVEITGARQRVVEDFRQQIGAQLASTNSHNWKADIFKAIPTQSIPKNCNDTTTDACNGALLDFLTKEAKKHLELGKSIFDDPALNEKITINSTHHLKTAVAREFRNVNVEHGERLNHIEDLFNEVKGLLIAKVKNDVTDPQKLDLMLKRLSTIKFDKDLCARLGEVSAKKAFESTAFYQPYAHAFSVCPSILLSIPSDTKLVTILAHELTHSIDICSFFIDVGIHDSKPQNGFAGFQAIKEKSFESNYKSFLNLHPYSEVFECLRSERSANAQSLDIFDPNYRANFPNEYTNHSCFNDRLVEAFPDWMSSHITAQYLDNLRPKVNQEFVRKNFANVFEGMCNRANPIEKFDIHSEMKNRTDGIYNTQPLLRSLMGCRPQHPQFSYCPFGKINSSTSPQSASSQPANLYPKGDSQR